MLLGGTGWTAAGVDRRLGPYLVVAYCSRHDVPLFDWCRLHQGFSALGHNQGDGRERWLQGRFRIFRVHVRLVFSGRVQYSEIYTGNLSACAIFCV